MNEWIKVCNSLGCRTTNKYKVNHAVGYVIVKYETQLDMVINLIISANIQHAKIWGRPICNIFELDIVPEYDYDIEEFSDSDIEVLDGIFRKVV